MYTAPKRLSEDDLDQRIPLSVAQWHEHVNFCAPPATMSKDEKREGLLGPDAKFGLRGSIATEQRVQCRRRHIPPCDFQLDGPTSTRWRRLRGDLVGGARQRPRPHRLRARPLADRIGFSLFSLGDDPVTESRVWPRVAVVGAGAVGGYFGGVMARAGAPVVNDREAGIR